jgi:transcriptional regulator with XRE-family HTH domain
MYMNTLSKQWVINGRWIAEVRETRGVTQAEFGKMLGISKQAVSQLEQEARRPTTRTVAKIANLFGVDPGKIFVLSVNHDDAHIQDHERREEDRHGKE